MQKMNNRDVEREKETKSIVDMSGYFLCISLFVIGVVGYIYPYNTILDIMYELETQERKRKNLIEKNQLLKVERASLKRFDRIEKIALNRLGLSLPKDGQVIYLKFDKQAASN